MQYLKDITVSQENVIKYFKTIKKINVDTNKNESVILFYLRILLDESS